MNDSVCEIFFDDVGIPNDGMDVGLFSGTACLDQTGKIVGLNVDSYAGRKSATRFYAVPNPLNSWIEAIAERITDRYAAEIRDAINTWFFEQDSQSTSDREEHGTYWGRP